MKIRVMSRSALIAPRRSKDGCQILFLRPGNIILLLHIFKHVYQEKNIIQKLWQPSQVMHTKIDHIFQLFYINYLRARRLILGMTYHIDDRMKNTLCASNIIAISLVYISIALREKNNWTQCAKSFIHKHMSLRTKNADNNLPPFLQD